MMGRVLLLVQFVRLRLHHTAWGKRTEEFGIKETVYINH